MRATVCILFAGVLFLSLVSCASQSGGYYAAPGYLGAYTGPLKVLKHSPPRYPEMARLAELEGFVTVRVLIDSSGKVTNTQVVQGIQGLNDAAETCILRWVFEAPMRDGKPVPGSAVVPIRFRLP